MPSLKDLKNRIESVKSTRKITRALAMAVLCKGAAAAAVAADIRVISDEARGQAFRNVQLFDDLAECASSADFVDYGLARGGPCRDWVDRIEEQRDGDPLLLSEGLPCLAGDIRLAGNSLRMTDHAHFAHVERLVDACRAEVEETR